MSHSHVALRSDHKMGVSTQQQLAKVVAARQPCCELAGRCWSFRLLTCRLALCPPKVSCPGAPPGRWAAKWDPHQGSKGACAPSDCLMEGMILTGPPSAHESGAGSLREVPCLRCYLHQQSMVQIRDVDRIYRSDLGSDLTGDHQGIDLLLLVPMIPHGLLSFGTMRLRSQLEAGQHSDSPRHRGRKKKRQRVSQLLLEGTPVACELSLKI